MGVLKLGEVKYDALTADSSQVSANQQELLGDLAFHFGVTTEAIEEAFVHNTVVARAQTVTGTLSRDRALYSRDALAKVRRAISWQ